MISTNTPIVVFLYIICACILYIILYNAFSFLFEKYKENVYEAFIVTQRKLILEHHKDIRIIPLTQENINNFFGNWVNIESEFIDLYKNPYGISALLSGIFYHITLNDFSICEIKLKKRYNFPICNLNICKVKNFPKRLRPYLEQAQEFTKSYSRHRMKYDFFPKARSPLSCIEWDDYRIIESKISIKFKIILDFLTWLFEKKSVILHQENVNNKIK